MDIASATGGRAGSYRRLADGLRAFLPKPLPPDPPLDMDEPLQVLLSGADQSLGRLDGAVQILPDSDLFVFMFMRREAVLSSQIEGTQSSLDDVLRAEAGYSIRDRPRDVGEVFGYIAALRHGTRAIAQGRSMSVELMQALHDRLMSGAGGGSLHPGRLRDDIVWIGPQGAGLDEATFVPPPAMEVSAHLHDLARFIEQDDSLPALVRIGLAHAQFRDHPSVLRWQRACRSPVDHPVADALPHASPASPLSLALPEGAAHRVLPAAAGGARRRRLGALAGFLPRRCFRGGSGNPPTPAGR